jgi:hypothetical protein
MPNPLSGDRGEEQQIGKGRAKRRVGRIGRNNQRSHAAADTVHEYSILLSYFVDKLG